MTQLIGSCAWDPHKGNKSQTDSLESVQKKAARFVCADWRRRSSVSAMIASLNWTTLQERRARARLAMFHKAQHSLVAIPMTLFTPSTAHMTTRGAQTKFHLPHCRTKNYQNSFIPAVVSLWNTLPADVASIEEHESFRSLLAVVRLCVQLAFALFLPLLNLLHLATIFTSFNSFYHCTSFISEHSLTSPLFIKLRQQASRPFATQQTDTDVYLEKA